MSVLKAAARVSFRNAVAIVIPCYNEAHRLPVEQFRHYLALPGSARLLFVDDGSTDGTLKLLDELSSDFPERASVLPCARNGGKGEAVRLGILHLIRTIHPDFVGFWDADLATPLDSIPRFVSILEAEPKIDMVFGSRIKLLGRDVRRDPRRHYLGRVFATVVSILLALPIYDTQCGAKLFRVSSGIEAQLGQPFLSKWVFDVEILARYRKLLGNDPHRLGAIIYEYPLECWHDIPGSKVRAKHFFSAAVDLLRIRARYLR